MVKPAGWGLALLCLASTALADNAAEQGARLYLQLPDALPSCVACHGPDPAGNRNNLLRAADRPEVLLKTLNAVGVMGYLKSVLGDAEIAALAAYLGSVARTAADGDLALWPRTIEFGSLAPGAASPAHGVRLRNLSALPMVGPQPRLAANRFLLEHDCGATLEPGADCRVSLRALAGATGAQADTLIFGAGTGASALVGVSAHVGLGPLASLSSDVPGIDFGTAQVGSTTMRRLSLRNGGTASATLGVAVLTGPGASAFTLVAGCGAGLVLAPGEACTAELSHRPGATVAYAAALQWRTEGAHPAPVQLLARGVAPPPATTDGGGRDDGDGGGSGGCAIGPAAAQGRTVDAGLPLWLGLALLALFRRRHRRHRRS